MGHSSDYEITERLRAAREGKTAVELAELLDAMLDGGLTQGALTTYFKRAFPDIPLRTLLEAGAWHRVGDGTLSDEAMNELLAEWLPRRS